MSPQTVESLGPQMAKRLTVLEQEIREGLRAFVRVGEALTEIRDEQLYRIEYDSFDEYVRHRWAMSRAHAYRLIDAAKITSLLSPTGDTPRTNGHAVKAAEEVTMPADVPPPKNEAQARALAPLKNDPDELRATWRTLHEEHGAEVTAEIVSQAVRARLDAREGAARPNPQPQPPAPQTGAHAFRVRIQGEVPTCENLGLLIADALASNGYEVREVEVHEA